MKVFLKSHRGLLIGLALCLAVIGYATWSLYDVPQTFQRAFLPGAQTAETKDGEKTNQYLRGLIDDAARVTTGLSGSCEPATLYAVAQPAAITAKKQKTTANARLVGIDTQYLSLENFTLYGGRYFYPDEYLYGKHVALVDEQLAVALFQYAEPLLEEIQLAGKTYTIIGIVRDHKRVGDQMNYSLYVPYRSLMTSTAVMSEIVYEAAPVKGSGGWASFVNATKDLGTTGTTISLPKETMNAALPLRILAVVSGAVLAFFVIGLLNRQFRRVVSQYRMMLREQYAAKLLGWITARGAALALGYALCLLVLAELFVLVITPVYTFPEWIPAILVEPKDIAAAFWNVWQTPAAAVEARTPELLRISFYARLMGWVCGLCGLLLGMLWGSVKTALTDKYRLNEPVEKEE